MVGLFCLEACVGGFRAFFGVIGDESLGAKDAVDGGFCGDVEVFVGEVGGDGFGAGVEALLGEVFSEFFDAFADGFWGAVGGCFGSFRAGLESCFSFADVAAEEFFDPSF